jgi:hypothetical protein
MLAPSQIQEIQGIKNIKTGISLGNMGEIQIDVRQIDVRQRPGFEGRICYKNLGASPATGFCSSSTVRHLVYTVNIPGTYLVYSWYDTLFLAPTATPSSSCFDCPCHWDPFGDGNDGD